MNNFLIPCSEGNSQISARTCSMKSSWRHNAGCHGQGGLPAFQKQTPQWLSLSLHLLCTDNLSLGRTANGYFQMTPPKDCSLITTLLLVPLIFDHTLNPHLPMGLSYPEPSPLDYNLSNALSNNLGGHIEKMPWFFVCWFPHITCSTGKY